jgi:hypothetical protein
MVASRRISVELQFFDRCFFSSSDFFRDRSVTLVWLLGLKKEELCNTISRIYLNSQNPAVLEIATNVSYYYGSSKQLATVVLR